VELKSGDTVFVPGAPVFYVYGAVQRPGAYRLQAQTSVRSAIALGGGLNPRGTERGLRIHRRMPDGAVRVLDAELSDPVESNDVIKVRESIF
jgi:polysaccharide export outer membrane protein